MNYPLVVTNIAMENDHFELGIIEHRHKLSNQLQAAMFPLRISKIWSIGSGPEKNPPKIHATIMS